MMSLNKDTKPMDYAFVHEGRAFTPNGTKLSADETEAHNRAIEQAELELWRTAPDHFAAYVNPEGKPARGVSRSVTATTWRGKVLGHGRAVGTWNPLQGWLWRVYVSGPDGSTYSGVMGRDTMLIRLRKLKA